MSRYRRGGWGGGGGMWPFMMYGQQPGGWSEQTMGMGFGQRPGRAHDRRSLWPNSSSGCDQPLGLEALSSLFTRLILQNHLTRLAGDTLGLGGRGLWGCSAPTPSCSQQHACSSPSSNCQTHPHSHGQQASGCGGINMCGHSNSINMTTCVCHTCPAATRPYMGTNNVFVIPAAHVQQQPGGGGLGNLGNFDHLNHNGLNLFLNGLGLAMGLSSGCGGDPMGFPGGFPLNDGGGEGRGPAMHHGPSFSCRGCNFQM